jgi:hypothetical protein
MGGAAGKEPSEWKPLTRLEPPPTQHQQPRMRLGVVAPLPSQADTIHLLIQIIIISTELPTVQFSGPPSHAQLKRAGRHAQIHQTKVPPAPTKCFHSQSRFQAGPQLPCPTRQWKQSQTSRAKRLRTKTSVAALKAAVL